MDAAGLQGVQRRAKRTVGLEGNDSLFEFVVECCRHGDAGGELQLDPVVGEIELRDPALDVAAGSAVDRRALEDEIAAVLEADAEMTGRCLIVRQVEPERRPRGVNREGMVVVAPEIGELEGIDDTVAAPPFFPEAIIAGRNRHRFRARLERLAHQRHHARPLVALRLLFGLGELRAGRGVEAEGGGSAAVRVSGASNRVAKVKDVSLFMGVLLGCALVFKALLMPWLWAGAKAPAWFAPAGPAGL